MFVCGVIASWRRGENLEGEHRETYLSFKTSRVDGRSEKQVNSDDEWLILVVGKGKVRLTLESTSANAESFFPRHYLSTAVYVRKTLFLFSFSYFI